MEKLIDRVLNEAGSMHEVHQSLSFSCACVEIDVSAGNKITGSFKIITDQKYKPEGYVYSNDIRMFVKTSFFRGLEQEVFFSYNSEGLESGKTYEGAFSIVSNLGEYTLPYKINVTSIYPVTSLGQIKNLFHFANLAQSSWAEAMDLFYSKQFVNILGGNDSQYLPLYRGLSYAPGNAKNLDEFLQITKKKTRLSFNVDKDKVVINNPGSDKVYDLNVVFGGWGIDRINIETYGDFIICDTEYIDVNCESSGLQNIQFSIDMSALHAGVNKGGIKIGNMFKTYDIPVTVDCKSEGAIVRNPIMVQRYELTKLYIDYRLGKIGKNDWLKNCNSIVGINLQKEPNDIETRLYQVQLLYAEKRADDAGKILDRVGGMLEESNISPELLGYYYYLCSLGCKDPVEYSDLSEKTELLYVQNISSYRLLYLVLRMKDEYVNDDVKSWDMLKQQYENGANSPIIFITALQIAIKNASVMDELSDFEIALMTFAMRRNVLTREMRNRFVFMCSKLVAYSDEYFELLKHCYEAENREETLSEICRILMKGNKTGTEYFKWYSSAVEMELRINRLYEYYIMSIDMNYESELPKLVLMFFAYRSNLSYERNAFLYANVLKHKNAYQDIYSDYYPSIEEFATQQLAKKRINEHLAYIYETVLDEKLADSSLAPLYSNVAFVNRIKVKDGFTKLVVLCEYLKEETTYSIYNNQIELSILPSGCYIFLEDEEGNRYADPSLYEKKLIIDNPVYIEDVMENAGININTAIYLSQLCDDGLKFTKRNEQGLLWLTSCDDIEENYKKEVLITLLNNYYENDEISRLDEVLAEIDPYILSANDRETCVRILVARGMYNRAFELVKIFGPEMIDYKILVRLCDRMLARTDYEYDSDLLKICEWLFKNSRYDEDVLKYMVLYSESTSMELKNIWKAADSFGIDVRRLLETMLVQVLYSGAEIGEEANIYLEYIARGANHNLEKLFLERLCYNYFAFDKSINREVLDRINYHNQMDEMMSVYCYLAYLKFDADAFKYKGLDTKERATVERYLKDMMSSHIFLPFFMEFKQIYPELEMYSDRDYIEYKGDRDSKVILHYVIERDGAPKEYLRDEMSHVIGGIFIKSFILFKGERIKYYITEEGQRQEKLTKSDVLESKHDTSSNGKKRFDVINNLVSSFEDDKDGYVKNLADYDKKRYMVNNLFDVEI